MVSLQQEKRKNMEQRPRYEDGWQAGKPMETPTRPRSGASSRRGRASSWCACAGQGIRRAGASCFKWPWESLAIIPTTVQRLRFTAVR